MNTYRVEYTEVKPGGHEDRQNDVVRGDRSAVVKYLSDLCTNREVVRGSIEVTEHTVSDGYGTPLGSLGFRV